MDVPADSSLLLVEDTLWVLTAPTGLRIYDFPFELFLNCRHPWTPPADARVVARIGAVGDYEERFDSLRRDGIVLINTPEEHARCSLLTGWYPLLEGMTPKSLRFDGRPDPDRIGAELGWPVFMKGARQTSGHRKALSIIENPDALGAALAAYAEDPVLRWQEIVCRQFVPLRPVAHDTGDKIPASFEFRTWWWRGRLVGFGRYWWEGAAYEPTAAERDAAVETARVAARRVAVPFMVVDVAQTADGDWIVIECNDAQESGYPGIAPLTLWRNIIEIERDGGG